MKNKVSNNKPWLSYEDQLAKLIDRGLIVTDKAKAIDYLERISYYRLSGYWYPFREWEMSQDDVTGKISYKRLNQFKDNTHFSDVVDLYIFDKKLRQLVMDAIERLEIAVRGQIAHLMGEYDPFAYDKPKLLHPNFTRKNKKTGRVPYDEWLEKHNGLVNRSSEEFVKHYRRHYGLPLPIWVAVELWDFGTMSKFYSGLRVKDKETIAEKYGVNNWMVMQSWLRSINYLRNICAHHNRLWNRNIIDQPMLPAAGEIPLFDPFIGQAQQIARPFLLFCILKHMLDVVCPKSRWDERFKQQLHQFPKLHIDGFGLDNMGCIEGWEDWGCWQKP